MSPHARHSPARAWVAPLIEAGGVWLLIMLVGTALIVGVLDQWRQQELQDIERAKLELTLREVHDKLEADLALGMELQHDPRIEELLQRQREKDPQIHTLEVLAPDGRTLFSTDRASVGEPLPPDALAAARQGAAQRRPWHAQIGALRMMGLGLHSAFGETAGHVGISYASHTAGYAAGSLVTVQVQFTLLAVALGGLAVVWLVTWPQRRLLHAQSRGRLAQVHAQIGATCARLDEGAARLDAVEHIE